MRWTPFFFAFPVVWFLTGSNLSFLGLFHAARKVRTVYWKIYNNLYIAAQDSVVPAYPTIPNNPSETTNYYRAELNMFI